MQKERLIGVGVFLLGLSLFFGLIPLGIDTPGSVDHITLSPDFWPKIISAMFGVMGLISIIKPFEQKEDPDEVIESSSWAVRLPRLGVVLTTLFGFYFLMDHLGMVVPGAAVIFGMMWFAGERRYGLMAGLALAVPILLYVFFVHVANIPIPLGIFESLRG